MTSIELTVALVLLIVTGLFWLTTKRRWAPVLVYWVILSLVSVTVIDTYRLRVGAYPISALDIAAFSTLIACAYYGGHEALALLRRSRMAVGILAVVVYGSFLALVGLLHHYHLYSVLIDLRTLIYLGIGYWAGRVLVEVSSERRLIIGMLWASAVGFVVAMIAATIVELRTVAQTGIQLIDRRDLGVPFFTGKFGLLISAARINLYSPRTAVLPSCMFVLTVWAVTFTFTRSAWLSAVVGLVTLGIYYGARFLVTIGGLAIGTLLLMLMLAAILPYGREFIAAAESKHLTVVGRGSGSLLASPTPSASAPAATSISPAASQASVSPGPPTSAIADTISFRLRESRLALSNLHGVLGWVFGTGLGLSVDDQVHPYQHDSLVWFLSKGGLIGLATFLWVIVILPTALGVRRIWTARPADPLLVVLVAGYVAGIVGGVTSGHLSYWSYSQALGLTIAWIEQLAVLDASSDDVASSLSIGSAGGRRERKRAA